MLHQPVSRRRMLPKTRLHFTQTIPETHYRIIPIPGITCSIIRIPGKTGSWAFSLLLKIILYAKSIKTAQAAWHRSGLTSLLPLLVTMMNYCSENFPRRREQLFYWLTEG